MSAHPYKKCTDSSCGCRSTRRAENQVGVVRIAQEQCVRCLGAFRDVWVPAFTTQAIKDYASANIALGTRVISDDLACFGGVAAAGMKHTAIVTGGGRPKNERLR